VENTHTQSSEYPDSSAPTVAAFAHRDAGRSALSNRKSIAGNTERIPRAAQGRNFFGEFFSDASCVPARYDPAMNRPDDHRPDELNPLAERLGRDVFGRRLARERRLLIKKTSGGGWIGRLGGKDAIIASFLRACGLAGIAHRQFLDVRIVTNRVAIRGLPAAFDGFRLAQITDLHCDLDPALMGVVENLLPGLACDAVVLTGDYHDRIGRPGDLSLALMLHLIPLLPSPRFCIFGNHDFLSVVPAFERSGLPVLLNEHAEIVRGGERIFLCGVDDPRFFRTHDLARARRGVPDGATAILLAHSPQVAAEAAALGYSFMICGHTHGGQICLPGGIPIVRNAPVPFRMLSGCWKESGMPGYTSRGTGACGVAARLFCPPEITLHVLVRDC
jgi:predicted MPP superfamily phosphohydrolase